MTIRLIHGWNETTNQLVFGSGYGYPGTMLLIWKNSDTGNGDDDEDGKDHCYGEGDDDDDDDDDDLLP